MVFILKTDLFLVELITASLERLLVEPKFSFELVVAKEDDRLSWKEDRWLADVLLRLTLLFLMFSRELETDFGGSMLSRLPKPGSDNWLLKLGGAELGQYLVFTIILRKKLEYEGWCIFDEQFVVINFSLFI